MTMKIVAFILWLGVLVLALRSGCIAGVMVLRNLAGWNEFLACIVGGSIAASFATHAFKRLWRRFPALGPLPGLLAEHSQSSTDRLKHPLWALVANPRLAARVAYGGWITDRRIELLVRLSLVALAVLIAYPTVLTLTVLVAPGIVARYLEAFDGVTAVLNYANPGFYWFGRVQLVSANASQLAEHVLAVAWAAGACAAIGLCLVPPLAYGSSQMQTRFRMAAAGNALPVIAGVACALFGITLGVLLQALPRKLQSDLEIYLYVFFLGELAILLAVFGAATVVSAVTRAWSVRARASPARSS